eukprot:IDg19442t1
MPTTLRLEMPAIVVLRSQCPQKRHPSPLPGTHEIVHCNRRKQADHRFRHLSSGRHSLDTPLQKYWAARNSGVVPDANIFLVMMTKSIGFVQYYPPHRIVRPVAMATEAKQKSETPVHYGGPNSPALRFEVIATWNKARASTLHLPHHSALTPMFMPVGTQATIKGLEATQLLDENVDAQVVLGNTYHLALRPGGELIDELGGL